MLLIRSLVRNHAKDVAKRTLRVSFRCSSTVYEADGETYIPPTNEIRDVPTKWEQYQYSLKDEITEYLEWKQEEDWRNIPKDEKRASYYISYGDWGPRRRGKPKYDTSYVVLRALFNIFLFGTSAMVIVNLKNDLKIKDELLKVETEQ